MMFDAFSSVYVFVYTQLLLMLVICLLQSRGIYLCWWACIAVALAFVYCF